MFNNGIVLFLTLVVFVLGLRNAQRRIREQRHALRPVPPITMIDRVPLMANIVGIWLTELILLGLQTSIIFIALNIAIETLERAPTPASGFRQIGQASLIIALVLPILAFWLSRGVTSLLQIILMTAVFGLLAILIVDSVGDDWQGVVMFGVFCYLLPALLVFIWRRS